MKSEQVQAVGPGQLGRKEARGPDIGPESRVVDIEDPFGEDAGVETLDQRSLGGVGHQGLTVGVADVSGQFASPDGWD